MLRPRFRFSQVLLNRSFACLFFNQAACSWVCFALFFWRSQGGLEVDMIIQARNKLWPIETKLTSTPSAHHAQHLDLFKEMAGNEASGKGLVGCNVEERKNLPGSNVALPWFAFPDWLSEHIG
jgi:hypothetical protein